MKSEENIEKTQLGMDAWGEGKEEAEEEEGEDAEDGHEDEDEQVQDEVEENKKIAMEKVTWRGRKDTQPRVPVAMKYGKRGDRTRDRIGLNSCQGETQLQLEERRVAVEVTMQWTLSATGLHST